MKLFCVYLTVYYGNKLPPFYIGSTSVDNVLNRYHGSVTSSKFKQHWKKELALNPQLFSTKIISYHKTREDAYQKEEKIQKSLNVLKNPLYINQGIANKWFSRYGEKLTKSTKEKISKSLKGKNLANETKLKISNSLTGTKRSQDTREKMSKAKLGYCHSAEAKNKMSQAKIGKAPPKSTTDRAKQVNTGSKRSKETCLKISAARKGKGCHQILLNGQTFNSKNEVVSALGISHRKLKSLILAGEASIIMSSP